MAPPSRPCPLHPLRQPLLLAVTPVRLVVLAATVTIRDHHSPRTEHQHMGTHVPSPSPVGRNRQTRGGKRARKRRSCGFVLAPDSAPPSPVPNRTEPNPPPRSVAFVPHEAFTTNGPPHAGNWLLHRPGISRRHGGVCGRTLSLLCPLGHEPPSRPLPRFLTPSVAWTETHAGGRGEGRSRGANTRCYTEVLKDEAVLGMGCCAAETCDRRHGGRYLLGYNMAIYSA